MYLREGKTKMFLQGCGGKTPCNLCRTRSQQRTKHTPPEEGHKSVTQQNLRDALPLITTPIPDTVRVVWLPTRKDGVCNFFGSAGARGDVQRRHSQIWSA